jgi:hypothetical protein
MTFNKSPAIIGSNEKQLQVLELFVSSALDRDESYHGFLSLHPLSARVACGTRETSEK